jgi:hypothetical protein
MKWDIPETLEKIVHVLETVYESFKVMLIAFAKSIGIKEGFKDSKSSSSVFNRLSNMQLPNVVFASFVVVFLLAVFSNGVAVTSIQHDLNNPVNGGTDNGNLLTCTTDVNNSNPNCQTDVNSTMCTYCNGTGKILHTAPSVWIKCENCSGKGYVHNPDGPIALVCPVCGGTGSNLEKQGDDYYEDCPVCGGKGYVPK